jgi:hypothetical protein
MALTEAELKEFEAQKERVAQYARDKKEQAKQYIRDKLNSEERERVAKDRDFQSHEIETRVREDRGEVQEPHIDGVGITWGFEAPRVKVAKEEAIRQAKTFNPTMMKEAIKKDARRAYSGSILEEIWTAPRRNREYAEAADDRRRGIRKTGPSLEDFNKHYNTPDGSFYVDDGTPSGREVYWTQQYENLPPQKPRYGRRKSMPAPRNNALTSRRSSLPKFHTANPLAAPTGGILGSLFNNNKPRARTTPTRYPQKKQGYDLGQGFDMNALLGSHGKPSTSRRGNNPLDAELGFNRPKAGSSFLDKMFAYQKKPRRRG